MSGFIERIAEYLLREHQENLQHVQVVFANKRAGLFLQKELATRLDRPIFQPEITSFEAFVHSQSDLKKVDTIEGIHVLYQVYKQHFPKETFDQFFFWGEMILRDFEEIDQYLVDPKRVFTLIENQKELDEAFFYLDEEDRKVIESFWNTFLPEATPAQDAFLRTWKILLPLYHEFTRHLKDQRLGYNGLIYREFIQVLPTSYSRPVVFAGFNALTFAEEEIIKHWVKTFNSRVFWDIDAYYIHDSHQEAGKFFRSYLKDPILSKTFPDILPNEMEADVPTVDLTGVSLEVGQTKALAEDLQKGIENGTVDPEKTAIILPKDHLLFPVLHALPAPVRKINVTMGYPMRDTSVYGLVESLLQLQIHKRKDLVYGLSFYSRPVMEVFSHPLVQPYDANYANEQISSIKKRNRVRISVDDIDTRKSLWACIFVDASEPLGYLKTVLDWLFEFWKSDGNAIEQAVLTQFIVELERLKGLLADERLTFPFCQRLIQKLARLIRLPFSGEPLEGLQVMGILETRNLDFEHVFILGLNEDSWPSVTRKGSFIPYNLRKGFNLPVYEHQDAIYAYLFYRLLHKSSHIHAYYNTVSEFNVNGEKSRYIRQLSLETNLSITERILSNPLSGQLAKDIVIEKDEASLLKLRRYTAGFTGPKPSGFSPSALETYLTCRLRFYFRYVLQLYQPDDIEDELDPMVFGTILHRTMELIYLDFQEKQKRDVVQPTDFFYLQTGVGGMMKRAFVEHFHVKKGKEFRLEGKNIIAADMVKEMAEQILKLDQAYAPFQIVGLEADQREGYEWTLPIEVAGRTYNVRLRGQIDRLDSKEGRVRVIDYKTGADDKQFELDALIDRTSTKRNKAAFQTLYYSLMYHKKHPDRGDRIEPGIFNTRDMFRSDFDWRIYEKAGRTAQPILDAREYFEAFENQLTELIQEIYDPGVPFDQTEDEKKCVYCEFRNICAR